MLLLVAFFHAAVSFDWSGPSSNADLSDFDITKGGAYRSYGTTNIRFIYPNQSTAQVVEDAFFAIDPANKRMRFSQGIYGSVYIRATPPSYATYPLPTGGLICGTIDAAWDVELRELALLTQKGQFRSIYKSGLLDILGRGELLTDYSGFASEVSQCGMGTALGFKLDSNKRVRYVSADTPLAPILRGRMIVAQYMDLPRVIPGIGDGSVFDLDPTCVQPANWCQLLMPGGPFALFNISYFRN
jgi:hypothetical protein